MGGNGYGADFNSARRHNNFNSCIISLSLNMCILTIYNLFLVNNCLTCLNFSTTDYGSRICVDFCEVWFYYFVLDDRSSCVADAIQLD